LIYKKVNVPTEVVKEMNTMAVKLYTSILLPVKRAGSEITLAKLTISKAIKITPKNMTSPLHYHNALQPPLGNNNEHEVNSETVKLCEG
jgi:hypothetical protein